MNTVDVITIAYNAAETIGQTIESVLAQRYRDWRYWIVDDGSTDGTADVARRYLDDERVQLLERDHQGAAHARNFPLDRVEGEFLSYLDADDYWEPTFLERLVPVLAEDPAVGLAWCEMAIFGSIANAGSNGTYRGSRAPVTGTASETIHAMFMGNTFLSSCSLLRTRFFREGLRWRPDCWPPDDMPVFTSVAAQARIAYVDAVLANYRIHEGSSSTSPGAVGRHYKGMLRAFGLVYRRHRQYIPHRSYRKRMWWICHSAADNLVCAGRPALPVVARALFYRPTATVTWKVLVQNVLGRVTRRSAPSGQ